ITAAHKMSSAPGGLRCPKGTFSLQDVALHALAANIIERDWLARTKLRIDLKTLLQVIENRSRDRRNIALQRLPEWNPGNLFQLVRRRFGQLNSHMAAPDCKKTGIEAPHTPG